jgi:hypothetical protein
MFEYLSMKKIIFIDNYLFGAINHELKNDFIEDMEFTENFTYEKPVTDCIFSHCDYRNIKFNLTDLKNVYFINCNFYNCTIDIELALLNGLFFNNCKSEPDFITNFYSLQPAVAVQELSVDNKYERHVLERFWPAGKDRFIPYKLISTLRLGVHSQEIGEIDQAIDNLIKRGIILNEKGKYAVKLNIEHINEIKQILDK